MKDKDAPQSFVSETVGGFSRILAGGTRNTIKLSRPWQPSLAVTPETCPFCTRYQEEIHLEGIPENWKLLPNPFTPHIQHKLAIPKTCWDEDMLYHLGGKENIQDALEIIRQAGRREYVEMAAFIHIGQIMGQNIGHAHWHILESEVKQPFVATPVPKSCLVKKNGKLPVYATGTHAGECMILPSDKTLFDRETVEKLADTIFWIVDLCSEKFRSAQGRPPEFIVAVRMALNGCLRYADYCPMLATWGAPQHIFGPLEGGPFTIAWPHEVTAEYLRS